MFLMSVFLVFVLFLSLACAAPSGDNMLLTKSEDYSTMQRHMAKRDVLFDIAAEANEPVDKDYDMELAEINVFRPVFRIRSSYLRRGG